MPPVTRGAAARAEAAARADPLSALGPDVLRRILKLLPVPDLKAAALVSKGWREVASEDDVWRGKCEELFDGLVYAPAARRADLSCKQRYLFGTADLARTAITPEELCAFRWVFHFKQTAGHYWTSQDPFWSGQGPPMQRLFSPGEQQAEGRKRPSGSLAAPPQDPLWGDHECRWQMRQGRRSTTVQINHWPALSVSRTPDGGWTMENLWVVYEAILHAGGPYSRGLRPELGRHLS